MPGNIGPLEIAVVLIIVLIIFGPKRLPELGRSMGRGIREFRNSIGGDKDKDDDEEEKRRELEAASPAQGTSEPATPGSSPAAPSPGPPTRPGETESGQAGTAPTPPPAHGGTPPPAPGGGSDQVEGEVVTDKPA